MSAEKQKAYRARKFISNDFFVTKVLESISDPNIRDELAEVFVEIYEMGGAVPARRVAMTIYPVVEHAAFVREQFKERCRK